MFDNWLHVPLWWKVGCLSFNLYRYTAQWVIFFVCYTDTIHSQLFVRVMISMNCISAAGYSCWIGNKLVRKLGDRVERNWHLNKWRRKKLAVFCQTEATANLTFLFASCVRMKCIMCLRSRAEIRHAFDLTSDEVHQMKCITKHVKPLLMSPPNDIKTLRSALLLGGNWNKNIPWW